MSALTREKLSQIITRVIYEDKLIIHIVPARKRNKYQLIRYTDEGYDVVADNLSRKQAMALQRVSE
jgi:hypothetical protein